MLLACVLAHYQNKPSKARFLINAISCILALIVNDPLLTSALYCPHVFAFVFFASLKLFFAFFNYHLHYPIQTI
jgi:hypothetical protein